MVPNMVTCNSLIDCLCKLGRISYVWDLIHEMHDSGKPANVINYNSLIDGLCKNSQLNKAIALFNREFDQMCTH